MNAPFKRPRFSRRALLKGRRADHRLCDVGHASALLDAQPRQGAARAVSIRSRSMPSSPSTCDGTRHALSAARSISAPACASPCRKWLRKSSASIGRQIDLIEGDTALTPDQGATAGSTGIPRGGVQIRQAAATARKALLELAATKLNVPGSRSRHRRWRGRARRAAAPAPPSPSLLAGKKFDSQARPQGAAEGSKDLHPRRQAAAAARRAGQVHRHVSLRARLRTAGHAARPRHPAAGDRRQAVVGR